MSDAVACGLEMEIYGVCMFDKHFQFVSNQHVVKHTEKTKNKKHNN